eukprot:6562292-Prorocentrum_lima.AAC.1
MCIRDSKRSSSCFAEVPGVDWTVDGKSGPNSVRRKRKRIRTTACTGGAVYANGEQRLPLGYKGKQHQKGK